MTDERAGQVWVDADACPVPIKEILFRAATRSQCMTTLLANHGMAVPPSPYLSFVQVPSGFDVADSEILKRLEPCDLVITQDIPLAAEVVERGALAISPRGERYTAENARARLAVRDFMTELRDSGVQTGGPAPLDNADKQRFANALDSWLAKRSQTGTPA
ncbi:YaiI/YqxD family protein [Congregibacter sp.]|uniref:YaiI/YqxD family protein n=1 Tax=Congregibacter sp. TaxID=2744308 RepID=UPI00385EFC3F